jgi:hypothetical protein
MTPSRFAELLAAYGGDPQRWPADERAAALAFAETRPSEMEAARALDRALDLAPGAVDADAVAARALAAFQGGAAKVTPLRRAHAAPIWALAACALIGLVIGFGAGLFAPSDAAYQTLADAFGGSFYLAGEESGG